MDVSQLVNLDRPSAITLLRAMMDLPGWTLYIAELQSIIDKNREVLEVTPQPDLRFIQGVIRGHRNAMDLPLIMIDSLQQEIENERLEKERSNQQYFEDNSDTPFTVHRPLVNQS